MTVCKSQNILASSSKNHIQLLRNNVMQILSEYKSEEAIKAATCIDLIMLEFNNHIKISTELNQSLGKLSCTDQFENHLLGKVSDTIEAEAASNRILEAAKDKSDDFSKRKRKISERPEKIRHIRNTKSSTGE